MTPTLPASNIPTFIIIWQFLWIINPRAGGSGGESLTALWSKAGGAEVFPAQLDGSGGHSSKLTPVAASVPHHGGLSREWLPTSLPPAQGSRTEDKRQTFITSSWKWHAIPILLSLKPILAQCGNKVPKDVTSRRQGPWRHLRGCRVGNHSVLSTLSQVLTVTNPCSTTGRVIFEQLQELTQIIHIMWQR